MPTRTESISSAYRQRAANVKAANEAAAPTAETGKFEPDVAVEEATEEDEVDDLPDTSWKKADIVGYLVRNEVVESEDDVSGLTKAELLENFIDAEG